jgi:hypothetical protein
VLYVKIFHLETLLGNDRFLRRRGREKGEHFSSARGYIFVDKNVEQFSKF